MLDFANPGDKLCGCPMNRYEIYLEVWTDASTDSKPNKGVDSLDLSFSKAVLPSTDFENQCGFVVNL